MRLLAIAGGLVVLATAPWWVGGTYYVNIGSQILLEPERRPVGQLHRELALRRDGPFLLADLQ